MSVSIRLPARIDTGRGSRLLHCIICDLSDKRARITLAANAKLPDEFVIVMTAEGRVRRRCRILWRDGLEFGVQFLPDRPEG